MENKYNLYKDMKYNKYYYKMEKTNGYLYLLQEPIDFGTKIHKVGQTQRRDAEKRISQYPKESKVHRYIEIDDAVKREKELLEQFSKHFVLARGKEYFKGDIKKMIKIFNDVCNSEEVVNNTYTDEYKNVIANIKYEPQQYTCNICNMIFNSKPNMYRHRKHVCLPKSQQKNSANYIKELLSTIKENDEKYKKILEDHISLTKEVKNLKDLVEELTPYKTNYVSLLEKSFNKTNKIYNIKF